MSLEWVFDSNRANRYLAQDGWAILHSSPRPDAMVFPKTCVQETTVFICNQRSSCPCAPSGLWPTVLASPIPPHTSCFCVPYWGRKKNLCSGDTVHLGTIPVLTLSPSLGWEASPLCVDPCTPSSGRVYLDSPWTQGVEKPKAAPKHSGTQRQQMPLGPAYDTGNTSSKSLSIWH